MLSWDGYIINELHHYEIESRDGSNFWPEPYQLHDIGAISAPRDLHVIASLCAGRAPSIYAGRANQVSRHCNRHLPKMVTEVYKRRHGWPIGICGVIIDDCWTSTQVRRDKTCCISGQHLSMCLDGGFWVPKLSNRDDAYVIIRWSPASILTLRYINAVWTPGG